MSDEHEASAEKCGCKLCTFLDEHQFFAHLNPDEPGAKELLTLMLENPEAAKLLNEHDIAGEKIIDDANDKTLNGKKIWKRMRPAVYQTKSQKEARQVVDEVIKMTVEYVAKLTGLVRRKGFGQAEGIALQAMIQACADLSFTAGSIDTGRKPLPECKFTPQECRDKLAELKKLLNAPESWKQLKAETGMGKTALDEWMKSDL